MLLVLKYQTLASKSLQKSYNLMHFLNSLSRTRQTTSVTAAATEAQPTAKPTGMDLDLPVDPNEPTYCFCNQVSYGAMVACDNPNVGVFFPAYIFLSILPTLLIYFLDLFKLTVQNRVVPFRLCWSERTTKRKMVLFKLRSNQKST